MNNNETHVSVNLEKLTETLERLIQIFEEDRETAKANYEIFKTQLDDILSKGYECSEGGKIEAEVNKALKMIFESSNKLNMVMKTLSELIVNQLNNDSREKIATQFMQNSQDNGGAFVKKVNLQGLLIKQKDQQDQQDKQLSHYEDDEDE